MKRISIAEFQRTKPAELRLGQHFFNCYFSKLGWNTRLHRDTQELYNTNSHSRALTLIVQIMDDYQWDDLPALVRTEGITGYWKCVP